MLSSTKFNQTGISVVNVDPEIPPIVARLRNMLIKAREENPGELQKLLNSTKPIAFLANWEKVNLMELAVDYPHLIKSCYEDMERFF